MMNTSALIQKKRKYFSPIQIPLEVPFAATEHIWVRLPNGLVREYIVVSERSYLDELGTELMLDTKQPYIRASPFARFVHVSEIQNKPCKVWVLDSETHSYTCGDLSESNMFRTSLSEYELESTDEVSLSPVHHSGLENGHIWSIQSNRLMIVRVRERVIVCSRPLWEISDGTDFVHEFVGTDSECESVLIALIEMNGFSCV